MEKHFVSNSPAQTEQIAEGIGQGITAPAFIALSGEMGMGKTTFVRGLAAAFDAGNDVSSPTFAFVNEYHGREVIYHFDLYRISDLNDLISIGYFDYLDQKAILVFEWPERIPTEALPEGHVRIKIEQGNEENDRVITVEE